MKAAPLDEVDNPPIDFPLVSPDAANFEGLGAAGGGAFDEGADAPGAGFEVVIREKAACIMGGALACFKIAEVAFGLENAALLTCWAVMPCCIK